MDDENYNELTSNGFRVGHWVEYTTLRSRRHGSAAAAVGGATAAEFITRDGVS